MKKKVLAALCCAAIIGSLAERQYSQTEETVTATATYKIAVITMDSVDQHWVSLKEGAEAEAEADKG